MKKAKELTAMAVSRIKSNGRVAVGGVAGLRLFTHGNSRSWVLRIVIGGRRRDIGIGSYPEVSLAEARARALEFRAKLRNGIDPLAERKATRDHERLASAKSKNFSECAAAYINENLAGWSSSKTATKFESQLERYAFPFIGKTPVAEIDIEAVREVLLQPVVARDGNKKPLREAIPADAVKLQRIIKLILFWATARKYRQGDNPADPRIINPYLPKILKEEKHHPALPYEQVNAFMSDLRQRGGNAARALEFLILTAARSGEVRGAKWDEIDFASQTWTIPAARMKMKRIRKTAHRVPLSASAVKLLKSMSQWEGTNYIFPSVNGNELSDMAMTALLRRMNRDERDAGRGGWIDPKENDHDIVIHGFRSTFRDWAEETTSYSYRAMEYALSHKNTNNTEAAYQRRDLLENRRPMMEAWAQYCNTVSTTTTLD